MEKIVKKFWKNFSASESIPNNLKSILASKNNFKFFLKKCPKMIKNVQKWPKIVKKVKNFEKISKNFFFLKSIQNGLKRVLKRKTRFWKFPRWKLFLGHSHFLTKISKFKNKIAELVRSVGTGGLELGRSVGQRAFE